MLPTPSFDANVVHAARAVLAAQGHPEPVERLATALDDRAIGRVARGELTVSHADRVRGYATGLYEVELRSLDLLGAMQVLSWAMDCDPAAPGQGTVPVTLQFDDAELDVYLLTRDVRAVLA